MYVRLANVLMVNNGWLWPKYPIANQKDELWGVCCEFDICLCLVWAIAVLYSGTWLYVCNMLAMYHILYRPMRPWCMPESLTSGFLWSRWRGKRSRHSWHMRNPQFYVSGKRPISKNGIDMLPLKVRRIFTIGQTDTILLCRVCFWVQFIVSLWACTHLGI